MKKLAVTPVSSISMMPSELLSRITLPVISMVSTLATDPGAPRKLQ